MASKSRPRGTQRRQRTIYLPESIDRKVRIRAAQLDTTISVVVGQALRAFFAAERVASRKNKKKRAP